MQDSCTLAAVCDRCSPTVHGAAPPLVQLCICLANVQLLHNHHRCQWLQKPAQRVDEPLSFANFRFLVSHTYVKQREQCSLASCVCGMTLFNVSCDALATRCMSTAFVGGQVLMMPVLPGMCTLRQLVANADSILLRPNPNAIHVLWERFRGFFHQQ